MIREIRNDPDRFPVCALCDRPVDRVLVNDDDLVKEIIITVECHGEAETVMIPRSLFDSHTYMRMTKAFDRKRLGG